MCKIVLDSNVTNFLTAGGMSWYGFISNLKNSC